MPASRMFDWVPSVSCSFLATEKGMWVATLVPLQTGWLASAGHETARRFEECRDAELWVREILLEAGYDVKRWEVRSEGKMFDSVKDHGGEHVNESTGATREASTGKGRFDLIPPHPIRRLAKHYENGAKKYADRNWEKGLKLSRFIDSTFRHLMDFMEGDRTEDHLAAIMWNVAGYMWTEKMIRAGQLLDKLRDVPWPDSVDGQ